MATLAFLCSHSAKMVSIGFTSDENRGEYSEGGIRRCFMKIVYCVRYSDKAVSI